MSQPVLPPLLLLLLLTMPHQPWFTPPSLPSYSDLEERVTILERLLRWRHLAPTAPDTLAAYPYFEEDPFILRECPHVLFAGGQPEFATAVAGGGDGGPAVRLVAVPSFAATGCVVLLNLATLACHPVYFDAEL